MVMPDFDVQSFLGAIPILASCRRYPTTFGNSCFVKPLYFLCNYVFKGIFLPKIMFSSQTSMPLSSILVLRNILGAIFSPIFSSFVVSLMLMIFFSSLEDRTVGMLILCFSLILLLRTLRKCYICLLANCYDVHCIATQLLKIRPISDTIMM